MRGEGVVVKKSHRRSYIPGIRSSSSMHETVRVRKGNGVDSSTLTRRRRRDTHPVERGICEQPQGLSLCDGDDASVLLVRVGYWISLEREWTGIYFDFIDE
jgi:hypothetical protein